MRKLVLVTVLAAFDIVAQASENLGLSTPGGPPGRAAYAAAAERSSEN